MFELFFSCLMFSLMKDELFSCASSPNQLKEMAWNKLNIRLTYHRQNRQNHQNFRLLQYPSLQVLVRRIDCSWRELISTLRSSSVDLLTGLDFQNFLFKETEMQGKI